MEAPVCASAQNIAMAAVALLARVSRQRPTKVVLRAALGTDQGTPLDTSLSL